MFTELFSAEVYMAHQDQMFYPLRYGESHSKVKVFCGTIEIEAKDFLPKEQQIDSSFSLLKNIVQFSKLAGKLCKSDIACILTIADGSCATLVCKLRYHWVYLFCGLYQILLACGSTTRK